MKLRASNHGTCKVVRAPAQLCNLVFTIFRLRQNSVRAGMDFSLCLNGEGAVPEKGSRRKLDDLTITMSFDGKCRSFWVLMRRNHPCLWRRVRDVHPQEQSCEPASRKRVEQARLVRLEVCS